MFHRSITQADPDALSRWQCEFGSSGHLLLSRFVGRSGLETIAGELRELAGVPSAISVDRHSDVLFDLARDPAIVGLAERLLGGRVVPLSVDFQDASRLCTHPYQDQSAHYEHFDLTPALAFWLSAGILDGLNSPLLQYSTVFPWPVQEVAECAVCGSGVTVPEGRLDTVRVFPGGCSVHHSLSVFRVPPQEVSKPLPFLVFRYRSSPYRDSLLSS